MLELPPLGRVLVYSQPIDMRKSFDGLYVLVKNKLEEEPTSGDLFLFLNRRRNYLKGLLWDRTGFLLIAKRLETGHFKLRNGATKVLISKDCLRKLLDGVAVGGVEIPGSKHQSSGHGELENDDARGVGGVRREPAGLAR